MRNSFDERSATAGGTDRTADTVHHHLDHVLGRIPGYRGYRDKEDRRGADRAIRDQLAGGLDEAAARVERVARDLADRRRLRDVSTVDAWVQALRHLANRIRNASYGYGGLFGDRTVDAQALDQLRQFDEAMLADLQRLEDPIGGLEAAVVANGDLSAAVQRGREVTGRLATQFDSRESVISSGVAEPQRRMQDLLSPAAQDAPAAAWHLDAGDALAIYGSDFLVDARLHVDAGNLTFRLFRLGERGDKRWLFVPKDRDRAPALLTETEAVSTEGLATDFQGSGQSELVGPGGASEPRVVNVTLLSSPSPQEASRSVILAWPDEQITWQGEGLSHDEISIFGAPTPQS
ncbi:MAG TPA: hypothetical protein VGR22_03795 [Thermomicrobiales bacterium]|nr:hypothetical protein [Thermomicrobiales bacterium]